MLDYSPSYNPHPPRQEGDTIQLSHIVRVFLPMISIIIIIPIYHPIVVSISQTIDPTPHAAIIIIPLQIIMSHTKTAIIRQIRLDTITIIPEWTILILSNILHSTFQPAVIMKVGSNQIMCYIKNIPLEPPLQVKPPSKPIFQAIRVTAVLPNARKRT
ncbi:hypothetical protein PGT21_012689 [Puccinia graminis f. sp. tritici]|uniref:Uncharacterized protein n=1 Tax=Puccinia graminis f. sp. tritici TaxID=56615 RepID=A0A5B0PRL5_PUCGR|nr:hypothetical protein PGT21_012689 [Puccinia graminis f. sp. tritici]